MTESLSLLVIGYGNSLRRDDGAGLLLAERLAACWREAGLTVQLTLTHQLMPELAEDMASSTISHIVFVDTRVAESDEAGLQIEMLAPANHAQQSLGHQMDPAMLLTYAAKLYGRAPSTYVITVAGVDFGFGDELSEGVLPILGDAQRIAQQVLASFGVSE